jgi:hypothetical protein
LETNFARLHIYQKITTVTKMNVSKVLAEIV